jgi:hypothetical protein
LPRWSDVLLIVKPETVTAWHRVGLRLYWRWRSRARGRPRITQELRDLIVRLAEQNPDWGAPKIHGELQKLGFTIAERSVARYLRRILHRGEPKRKWLAFLQNHREVIASCRREILDHIIALNEQHLCRILREYVRYHQDDRLHDSLEKEAPNGRVVEQRPGGNAKVLLMARLGGLHHRHTWGQAA